MSAGGSIELSPTRERVVRSYYGALALLLACTLVAQVRLSSDEGRSIVNMFSYFTIQSNVLVFVTALAVALRPRASGVVGQTVRLAALCGITLTGLVYGTIIAPHVHLSGEALVYDYVFHYVVPAAAVVGFVFVGPRTPFRTVNLVFLVWPVLWLVYTMVRGAVAEPVFRGLGEVPSHYPYHFLDVDRLPTEEVAVTIVVIALVLVGLGFAFLHGERWLESRSVGEDVR
ncbi:MAG TPA: Pr6Pr family membrane protein [Acidimicrobiia bacterium]|nr:Pr6Pr family membrane protein [Acidimicrobiia bacterium]